MSSLCTQTDTQDKCAMQPARMMCGYDHSVRCNFLIFRITFGRLPPDISPEMDDIGGTHTSARTVAHFSAFNITFFPLSLSFSQSYEVAL